MPKLPSDGSLSKSLEESERNKNYAIVKGNEMVQNTRYTMPLSEQKILARLISMIKPGQTSLKLHFSTRKYMKLLGMKWSGSTFNEIMYSLKHIADDSFFIQHTDGSYDLWRWLSHVHADPNGKGRGDFIVTFPKALKPYLFDPRIRYKTIYRFNDIMMMRSRYSPRLFEIFKSNQSRQKVQKRGLNYSLNELKYQLNLVYHSKRTKDGIKHKKDGSIKYKYPVYSEFKRNVLKPVHREINRYTEYNVKFRAVHRAHSRKTIGINVVMTHKNKNQMENRNVLLYCMMNNVPKSQRKLWRTNLSTGKFYKVRPRNSKTAIDGTYRVIRNGSRKNIKHHNTLVTGKKHPFARLNRAGALYQYYNPLLQRLAWTTDKTRKHFEHIYWQLVKKIKYND